MTLLLNLRTRTKLLMSVALVAVAGIVVGIVAIAGMASMQAKSKAMYEMNV